jgi:TonB family protein
MPFAAVWRSLLALCAGLAMAGVASADPNEQPSPGPAAYVGWSDHIVSTLKLTAAQQAAFRLYVEASEDRSAQGSGLSADQFRAMTAPGRLDYVAQRIAKDLQVEQRRAAALHQFYALLTPDQRRLFDTATAPPGGRSEPAGVVTQSAPDQPDYNLPSHTNANWLQAPSADDIGRVYPSEAQQQHIAGHVQLTCTVDADGYLTDCVVDSETPDGAGFGNAALELTAYLRFVPAKEFGVPILSKVSIPISFTPR